MTSTSTSTSTTAADVLVVGAGPAGLTLTADLLRRGLTVRLIDRAEAPSATSRATSLTPRTLEVLDDLGVAQALLGTGIRITRAEAYQGSRPTFRLAFPPSDRTRFPFLLNNSQQQTELVLAERVRELGGRVERARTLTAFRQERGGVVAHVDGPAGAEEIRATWLVGADGGRSTVRRTLGIPFRGKESPEETIVLADVLVDWDRTADRLYTWFNEDGALLAFPFREARRWRLTAALSPAEESDGRYTEESIEQFTRLYRRRTGDDVTQLSDLTGFSVYRVNQRVVDQYRRGRVLLAGDAAHIHTPAGGLGMNTGIQDAYNLGWRLALAVQVGDDRVVDGYEQERRPVAEALLSSTGGLQRLYSIRDRRVQRARDVALQLVLNAGPTRMAFFAGAGQLDLTYRRRRLPSGPATVHAGDRSPDGPATLWPEGSRTWLHDHFRGPDPPRRSAAVRNESRRSGHRPALPPPHSSGSRSCRHRARRPTGGGRARRVDRRHSPRLVRRAASPLRRRQARRRRHQGGRARGRDRRDRERRAPGASARRTHRAPGRAIHPSGDARRAELVSG